MRIQTNKRGLTLVEIMIVVLIIAVAVIGAINFRFFGVTNAKKADVQANATRIGSMMLETWKGLGDVPTDPLMLPPYLAVFETAINNLNTNPHFTLSSAAIGSAAPSFTAMKSYQIRDLANGVYYFATLSYKPAVTGSTPEPQAFNVSISWFWDYGTSDPQNHGKNIISLSTYLD